jgi:hypothetical protein
MIVLQQCGICLTYFVLKKNVARNLTDIVAFVAPGSQGLSLGCAALSLSHLSPGRAHVATPIAGK